MLNGSISIGFPYIANRFGGSNISSLVLAKTLQARGHRVVVLAHGSGRMIDETRNAGIEIVELAPLSSMDGPQRDRARLGDYLALSSCLRTIQRLKLQIVHTNDLAMLRTWALPTSLSKAMLVAHWRSNYVKSHSVNFGLRLARKVISVSQYSKDALPKWAQRKTDVIYNPFGLFFSEEQRTAARKTVRLRLGIPDNAAILGVFGYHTVRKRTHLLADTLQTLTHTADGRPIYGLACGERAEPYDTELYRKVAEYSLEKRLLMPGFVRPVEEWMAACDIVLAPAEKEPFARNVLEAQGLGIPVIVSSDGGLREWVEDGNTGDLLDPKDISVWIARIRLRLDDAAGSATIAKNAQIKIKTLSPESHTHKIESIYQHLLSRESGG